MLGAIIGDIVGSVYEWNSIKTKDFPLFKKRSKFTDDTVMTCAVAEAIMNGGQKDDFIDAMKKYGRMFPRAGYGGNFGRWISSDITAPYNSFGNGSAMRVSPCGWVKDCDCFAETGTIPKEIRTAAKSSAEVTHNHPEGIKGAMAVADAIYLCRYYFGDYEDAQKLSDAQRKQIIKEFIEREYGYDLSKTLDEIRPAYSFDVACQGSVPQSIIAFLESTDYEDAIRNAISLGGDSDTMAAIAGGIAEAAYGVPESIRNEAVSFLPDPLKDVLTRWEQYISGLK